MGLYMYMVNIALVGGVVNQTNDQSCPDIRVDRVRNFAGCLSLLNKLNNKLAVGTKLIFPILQCRIRGHTRMDYVQHISILFQFLKSSRYSRVYNFGGTGCLRCGIVDSRKNMLI